MFRRAGRRLERSVEARCLSGAMPFGLMNIKRTYNGGMRLEWRLGRSRSPFSLWVPSGERGRGVLRVRLESSRGIVEPSQHEADGGEKRRNMRAVKLRFSQSLASFRQRLSQAMVRSTIQRLGKCDEALRLIGSLDDLDLDPRQGFADRSGEDRPLIGAVGEQFFEIGEPAKQRRKQQSAAVAILDIGGMNDGLHQQPLGVDEKMALLALDLFSGIEPVRIDRGPPFSALFTLWLSMMAAVGLASRSACARHFS